MTAGRIETASDARRFLHAGKATLTLKSAKSGKHLTYRVASFAQGTKTSVALLTGPDNTSNFTYLGLFQNNEIVLTAKSKMTKASTPVRAFEYMAQALEADQIAADLEIYHEGRCGRCSRKLTHPESLKNGMGPECINK